MAGKRVTIDYETLKHMYHAIRYLIYDCEEYDYLLQELDYEKDSEKINVINEGLCAGFDSKEIKSLDMSVKHKMFQECAFTHAWMVHIWLRKIGYLVDR